MLSRRPRAVLFDLDGVLLDTEPLYTQAAQALVSRYGARYDWGLKRQTMGRDARIGARLVIDTLKLPLTVEEYMSERGRVLRELFERAPAMPGAERFVQQLKAGRVPFAIGTSSERGLCEIKFRAHPWLREIRPLICGDDPEIEHCKPAPDIYLAAAARLGVPASDCLVFEDSPAGVQAARRAGMQVIAIPAPELPQAEVAAADAIIAGFEQLDPATLGLGVG